MNPGAGYGRADVFIMPKAGEFSTNAVILEFKQTEEKDKLYINEAQKRGAKEVYAYGIGFFGRDIKVIMEKIEIQIGD